MNAVADLRYKVESLKSKLRDAEDRLQKALVAQSRFKLGDIYQCEASRGYGQTRKTIIKRAVVTGFRRRTGMTQAVLSPVRDDGTVGVRGACYATEDDRLWHKVVTT